MEEITFWVCTRRAPCLYRYNNVYKKKSDEAHCSKYRNSSEPSFVDEVPSTKKKKRKLRLLEDDSVSTERQQNLYFEKSHKRYQRSWYSSSKSRSDRSDVDFNLRSNSFQVRNKSKTSKLQQKNPITLHKKSKIITSTPKPTTLRRSLRRTRQILNTSQLNCSLDIFNTNVVNGDQKPMQVENNGDQTNTVHKNHTCNNKRGEVLKEQSKNEIVPNGHFEDMSDVSGFTANYIRSTKLNSKTPTKARSKPSRNLMRESQQKLQKDESKIIVCVNRTVNADLTPPVLNQSTDSSQNVINLVTVNYNNNDKSLKINQNTPQLKCMDSKSDHNKDGTTNVAQNLNISFQSKSSGVSRYPKRCRNNSKVTTQDLENSNQISTSLKKKVNRELKSINQNEQPDISLVSRTRSGKQIGVVPVGLGPDECSHSQMNKVADQVSSSVVKDVAPAGNTSVAKKRRVKSTKCAARARKATGKKRKDSDSDIAKKNPVDSSSSSSPGKCGGRRADKRQSLKRVSSREKSGFAACFSDSEEDKPLIQRKFFC